MKLKIRELAAGLQFPEGPIALSDGSVLVVEIARGTLTRVLRNGKIQVLAELGGGPNGAAVGPDGEVYICNNGGFEWTRDPGNYLRPIGQANNYSGGRIERVNLNTGRSERLYDSVEGFELRGPNDLVFDAHGGFYFTDLGKSRKHEFDYGGLYYAQSNVREIHSIARQVLTPNGIALSPDGNTLYYSETAGARVWAYNITEPGQIAKDPWPSPQGAYLISASPGNNWQRFDSMAVDALGNLCVATLIHSGITLINPYEYKIDHISLPDPLTTNICFGGLNNRTAFITLSSTGRLIAIDDWPTPGLVLNYNI